MNFDMPIPAPGALPFPIAGAQPVPATGTDGFAALLEIGTAPLAPAAAPAAPEAATVEPAQKAEIAIAKAGALVGAFLDTPDTVLPKGGEVEPEAKPQQVVTINAAPLPVALTVGPRKAAALPREIARQPEGKAKDPNEEAPADDAAPSSIPSVEAETVPTVVAAPMDAAPAPVAAQPAKKPAEIILVVDTDRPAPRPAPVALPAPVATPEDAAPVEPAAAAIDTAKPAASAKVESPAEPAIVDAAPVEIARPVQPKRDAVRQIFVADAPIPAEAPLPAEAPAVKAARFAQVANAAPAAAAAIPLAQPAKPVRALPADKPETVDASTLTPAPIVAPARTVADVQPVSPATATAATAPQHTAPVDTVVERQLDLVRNEQWLGDLARDIAETAKGGDRLEFKLMPQQLGRLDIGLTRHHEGISLSIRTETESARAILTAAQPHLAEEIRATGLKLTDTQMFTGDNRQQQGSQAAARAEALIEAAIPAATETTEAERDEARDGRYA